MIASLALQKAIFAALNGAITGGVYDEVTPGAAAPYTVIGETASEVPWDYHDSEGSDEEIMLHVWSRTTGSTQVKQIMAQIDDRLHDAKPVLETGSLVSLRRTFMTVIKEEVQAGETWRHGVLRYRALITT